MRQTSRDPEVWVYREGAGPVFLGIAILTGGVGLAVPGAVLLSHGRALAGPPAVFLAVGAAMAALGLWLATYRNSITVDGRRRTVARAGGPLFLRRRRTWASGEFSEVGTAERFYQSTTTPAHRRYRVLELRVPEGAPLAFEDDEVSGDDDRARERARELAALLGVRAARD